MPFYDLHKMEEKNPSPGFKVYFIHTENMTLAHWTIDKGAVLPLHSHPHEQVSNVIEGEFELTMRGETRVLKPGVAAVIPGDTPHEGKALTPCRIIDAFYPVREDYR